MKNSALTSPEHLIKGELRLVPVIELEPERYGRSPILPGSWLFPLEALKSSALLCQLLQDHFGAGVPTALNEIGPFSGGFALMEGSEVLLLPTCCGDLGNLNDWQAAVIHKSRSPAILWIGHPWLMVWYQDSMLHLQEEVESNLPLHPQVFVIHPAALQQAIHLAVQEIDHFYGLIIPLLHEFSGVIDAQSIARRLVGRSDG